MIICCPSAENDRLTKNLIHKSLSFSEVCFMLLSTLNVSAFSDFGLRVVNADKNPVWYQTYTKFAIYTQSVTIYMYMY